jgi:hypothetical protein
MPPTITTANTRTEESISQIPTAGDGGGDGEPSADGNFGGMDALRTFVSVGGGG